MGPLRNKIVQADDGNVDWQHFHRDETKHNKQAIKRNYRFICICMLYTLLFKINGIRIKNKK